MGLSGCLRGQFSVFLFLFLQPPACSFSCFRRFFNFIPPTTCRSSPLPFLLRAPFSNQFWSLSFLILLTSPNHVTFLLYTAAVMSLSIRMLLLIYTFRSIPSYDMPRLHRSEFLLQTLHAPHSITLPTTHLHIVLFVVFLFSFRLSTVDSYSEFLSLSFLLSTISRQVFVILEMNSIALLNIYILLPVSMSCCPVPSPCRLTYLQTCIPILMY